MKMSLLWESKTHPENAASLLRYSARGDLQFCGTLLGFHKKSIIWNVYEPILVSKFWNLPPLTHNTKLLPQKVGFSEKNKNWDFFSVSDWIFFSYPYPQTNIMVQNFWRWKTWKILFVCSFRGLFVIFFKSKSKWYSTPEIDVFCQNH